MTTTLSQHEEIVIRTFQLLGDATRFKIYKLLMNDEELCVSEIAKKLNISVSAVSQHFRMFEESGLVTKKRYGQKICYQIQSGNQIMTRMAELI